MEQITLIGENDEEFVVYVLEETELGGKKYYLAAEDEEGDCDAYILKEVTVEGDESVLEIVEDEVELEAVAKLFEELVGEDAGIEYKDN